MFESKAKALADALGGVPQMKTKWLLQSRVRWWHWAVGVEFETISRLAIHMTTTPRIYGVLVMLGPLQFTLSWDRVPVGGRNYAVAQGSPSGMVMSQNQAGPRTFSGFLGGVATTKLARPPSTLTGAAAERVKEGFEPGFDVAALQELRKRRSK